MPLNGVAIIHKIYLGSGQSLFYSHHGNRNPQTAKTKPASNLNIKANSKIQMKQPGRA